jgi:hypothetical protein
MRWCGIVFTLQRQNTFFALNHMIKGWECRNFFVTHNLHASVRHEVI